VELTDAWITYFHGISMNKWTYEQQFETFMACGKHIPLGETHVTTTYIIHATSK
jgi:hypothetical protein